MEKFEPNNQQTSATKTQPNESSQTGVVINPEDEMHQGLERDQAKAGTGGVPASPDGVSGQKVKQKAEVYKGLASPYVPSGPNAWVFWGSITTMFIFLFCILRHWRAG